MWMGEKRRGGMGGGDLRPPTCSPVICVKSHEL